MNEQIRSIADDLQKEFGLNDYVLKRTHIFSETNFDNETNYILSLEWFPADRAEKEDGDFNPDGSAILDVDFHTKKLRSLIFVNDISYADEGIFPIPEIEYVMEWVEEISGMMFGRQFKLMKETGNKFSFKATVDNIDVEPMGTIEVEFNEDNQLTLFSIDGIFPTEDEIEWEPFSLTKEDVLDEIKRHLTLVETPMEEEEKWLKAWHLNQVFIRNDKSEVILPETINRLKTYIELNVNLKWENAKKYEFIPEDIDLSTEVSYEDAMEKVTVTPISEGEVQTCLGETEKLLSSLFPDDSGKWTVVGMYPEKNYIITEMKGEPFKAFHRKLKVIIDHENHKAINYWDNKMILDMFQSYKEPGETTLNKDDAFEKIQKHVEVIPTYVKDNASNRYRLCGKVDCDVVVDPVTGELIHINDL